MTSPVLTLTLNPALDQTVALEHLQMGEVNRAQAAWLHAAGKGVNVASCLADWDHRAITAAGFLGVENQAAFVALFKAKGIRDGFVRVPGETRTNIKLSHDGQTTDINLPGLIIPDEAVQALCASLPELIGRDGIMLLSGSLPGGVGAALYPDLVSRAAALGARVLVDSSGSALQAVLNGPVLPYAIKPNREEFEAVIGRTLADEAALIQAARGLNARGVEIVAVSLGAKGALFVTAARVLRVAPVQLRVVSTVGGGDAMVAGVIAALREGAGLERLAGLAAAFAAGKLAHPGATLPPRPEIEALAKTIKITHE